MPEVDQVSFRQGRFTRYKGNGIWSLIDVNRLVRRERPAPTTPGGGVTSHEDLTDLAWTDSPGHTGTANRVAGFDAGGVAKYFQIGADLQAWDADLDGLAGLGNGVPVRAGGSWSAYTTSGSGTVFALATGATLATPTLSSYVTFTDATAAAGAAGRLQRNGANLSWHNGSAAKDLAQVAGQLGGTGDSPDVRGLRETGGPTALTLGAVADGQLFARSGSTVVGVGGPGGTWTFIEKTTTTSRTNTTTLADDPDLQFSAVSGGVYQVKLHAKFNITTSNPDLKVTLNGPTASVIRWNGLRRPPNSTSGDYTAATDLLVWGTTVTFNATGNNQTGLLEFWAYFVATSSATFALQWAQNTLDAANAAEILEGSYLEYRRVA